MIINATALHIPLADESVHCLQVLSFSVLLAVNPNMALVAKSHDIGEVEPQFGIACPGLDMVGVESALVFLTRTAMSTSITIMLVHLANNLVPFARSIGTLTFGRATINISRIQFSKLTKHAIENAAQIELGTGSFLAQDAFGFLAMVLACKRVFNPRYLHVVIRACQIVAERSSRYSKVNQFLIYGAGISPNKFRNVVSGQTFISILLS